MSEPISDIDALLTVLAKFGWERHHATAKALVKERNAAIKERDEARRDVCRKEAFIHLKPYYAHQNDNDIVRFSKAIAKDRGWDCFAQQEGGGA